jgi:hypothetical protein
MVADDVADAALMRGEAAGGTTDGAACVLIRAGRRLPFGTKEATALKANSPQRRRFLGVYVQRSALPVLCVIVTLGKRNSAILGERPARSGRPPIFDC